MRTIPGLHYHQAACSEVDFNAKQLHCTEVFKNLTFSVDYDFLVLAPGSETNTFNVPGVEGNPRVFFLKQLDQARLIRNKLIESFERAGMPSLDPAERARLLTFVVVGGGPTNVEFASELHDFLMQDVARCYKDLLPYVKVVVVEASGHILGTFKSSLVDYVEKLFKSRSIEVRTGTTVNAVVDGNVAVLGDGTRLPFGMMVWSTGIKQVGLIRDLPDSSVAHARGGRIVIDGQLRLLSPATTAVAGATPAATGALYGPPIGGGSVYAMGDCACDSVRPLPALAQVSLRSLYQNMIAIYLLHVYFVILSLTRLHYLTFILQVAAQQGKYLAKVLNSNSDHFSALAAANTNNRSVAAATASVTASSLSSSAAAIRDFKYSHLGSMASVGDWKGVIDTPNICE